MTLTCMGAARTVTGSKHLLDAAGHRLLVDCGLFQGLKELRERNWQALPVLRDSIETVVLTHAHLDHCGYLPRLVESGLSSGRIFCTPATAELARIVLADAAKLQEEDAERANRKGYTKHSPALPLFTTQEAARAMSLLQPRGLQPAGSGRAGHHSRVHQRRAPAGIGLRAAARSKRLAKTILFGGDLGRFGRPVLPDPDAHRPRRRAARRIHVRRSRARGGRQRREARATSSIDTAQRLGKVIIPAFALGRVEELLYWIKRSRGRAADSRVAGLRGQPDGGGGARRRTARAPTSSTPNIAEQAPNGWRARRIETLCAFCTARLKVISSIPESRAVQESPSRRS